MRGLPEGMRLWRSLQAAVNSILKLLPPLLSLIILPVVLIRGAYGLNFVHCV